MDAQNISCSILSISSPGTALTLNNTLTKSLCREVNDYAADLKRQHPKRFGFFASLPLPDIEGTIAEIQRVKAEGLNPDGFVLLSNALGLYLGDPALHPVLEALNAIDAVIFVHPTAPCSRHNVPSTQPERYETSSPLARAYKAPMYEFFFDSARSLLDLMLSGTAEKYPRIKWLVSHCGGVLPSLLDRMFLFAELGMNFTTPERAVEGVKVTEEGIRKFLNENCWFDLAGNPVPALVNALGRFVGKERLVFGTDVPWTPFPLSAGLVKKVEIDLPQCVGEEWLKSIYSGAAEGLLGNIE